MQPPPQAAGADPRAFVLGHTRALPVPLCPELSLQQADALTALWEASERDLGVAGIDVPFWAVPWPGGVALARYLLDHPALVRGRRVLDLGTGSGLCALAAARAGAADVLALDADPVAVTATQVNAWRNGLPVQARCDDPLREAPPSGWDVVLAADLWYERFMARQVTPWLRAAAAGGALALAGDPGRAYLPRQGLALLATFDVPTSLDLEQHPQMATGVYRVLPAAAPG